MISLSWDVSHYTRAFYEYSEFFARVGNEKVTKGSMWTFIARPGTNQSSFHFLALTDAYYMRPAHQEEEVIHLRAMISHSSTDVSNWQVSETFREQLEFYKGALYNQAVDLVFPADKGGIFIPRGSIKIWS